MACRCACATRPSTWAPARAQANNEFNRIVLGVKGNAMGWDYDAGYTHSESKLHLDYSNMLNMAVVKDALGNPNSKYFPYYIGAQAGKNPASLYAAMVTNATSDSTTKLDIIDFKASRELMQLPGGAMGLAVGAEHRRDKLDNPSLSGTENGSINSSYVAAKGDSKVSAVFLEVLAPVIKTVELSGALRYDKYDRFSSTTPKLGAKWTPLKTFAVRGTYSEGFRAPGPAESNANSQSTGTSTVSDPVRCPAAPACRAPMPATANCKWRPSRSATPASSRKNPRATPWAWCGIRSTIPACRSMPGRSSVKTKSTRCRTTKRPPCRPPSAPTTT